jgi:hypothetical protein
MNLPTFTVAGMTLVKRMALVIDDGVIVKVFYPVFPPDKNAAEVVACCARTASLRVSAPPPLASKTTQPSRACALPQYEI